MNSRLPQTTSAALRWGSGRKLTCEWNKLADVLFNHGLDAEKMCGFFFSVFPEVPTLKAKLQHMSN